MDKIKSHSLSFLHHNPTGKTVEALDFEQLTQLCEIIQAERSEANYLVWTNNFESWMPLENHIDDVLNSSDATTLPDLPEQISASPIHHFSEAQMEQLQEKRDYDRVQKEVPVTLEIDGQIYKTETEDISVNGMSFKKTFSLNNKSATGFAYYQHRDYSLKFKIQPIVKSGSEFRSVRLVACTDFAHWISVVEDQYS